MPSPIIFILMEIIGTHNAVFVLNNLSKIVDQKNYHVKTTNLKIIIDTTKL